MTKSTCDVCDGKGYYNRRAHGAVGGWEKIVCDNPDCLYRTVETKKQFIVWNGGVKEVLATHIHDRWQYNGWGTYDTPLEALDVAIAQEKKRLRSAITLVGYFQSQKVIFANPLIPMKCPLGHTITYMASRIAMCRHHDREDSQQLQWWELGTNNHLWSITSEIAHRIRRDELKKLMLEVMEGPDDV